MKISRQQLRKLILKETNTFLNEGDPEHAISVRALAELREMVDVGIGGKMRDPDLFEDPRTAVIAIIESCAQTKLISTQQAEELKSKHGLNIERQDI
tara:strand:- start:408 stop:698 length:291 start_codon:yes stop_codon:yes gene_type:complete